MVDAPTAPGQDLTMEPGDGCIFFDWWLYAEMKYAKMSQSSEPFSLFIHKLFNLIIVVNKLF